VFSLLGINSGVAAAETTDARTPTDLSSFIDEPGYTFANTSVLIYGYLVVPAGGPVPTGTISVRDQYPGSKTASYSISGGVIDFGLSFITPNHVGPSAYVLSYSGDANYQPSTRTYPYEVLAGPWTITKLSSPPTRSTRVGDSIDITANVYGTNGSIAGHTTGYIYLYDNGELVSTGNFGDIPEIPFTVTLWYAGTHKFTAIFEPTNPLPYAGSTSKSLSVRVSASK